MKAITHRLRYNWSFNWSIHLHTCLSEWSHQKFLVLEQNIIPLMPMEHTFLITQGSQSSTVVRKQPPLTAAYAFTDYWLQEQTIQNAIIDIASPPMGTLMPFNIYVALSWSRGHEGICLLHNFDEKLLIMHPSEISRAEDKRLTRINEETKNWWKGFHVPNFA